MTLIALFGPKFKGQNCSGSKRQSINYPAFWTNQCDILNQKWYWTQQFCGSIRELFHSDCDNLSSLKMLFFKIPPLYAGI